jgi:hypothetical protein
VEPAGDALAARLGSIRERLDHPPGVMLGVLRLPVLDPILDELEAMTGTEHGAGHDAAVTDGPPLTPDVVDELERLAEVLSREMLGTAAEAVQRRVRVVELIRRAGDGRLPRVAADDADPFGVELRTMLDSDDELRARLGRLHPLVIRATSVAPSARWLRDARALASARDGDALAGATNRVLAALVRAPIVSRPDLLIGGLRLANQRLARGLVWFANVALPAPAETLGAVGLRMGTSGRNDAVVRDVALANTCAALLGESSDPGAAAALASMRSQVTNRVVLKQVDRALETLAATAGMAVDELVDLALPAFGLDERGRTELEAGPARAIVEVTPDAGVVVRWRLGDGGEESETVSAPTSADPSGVAVAASLASAIETAIAEERRRLEDRLGSVRTWPLAAWRRRFDDHPVARPFGRRLVWLLGSGDGDAISALPVGAGWIGRDERPIREPADGSAVRLWHPAEAGAGEVAAWQATLAARGVRQLIRQVDREVFAPVELDRSPAADRRFGGRIVDHAQLRALLRGRGWAVPALGAWDLGDEASGWRVFDDGLRAELRYQALDHAPTAERVMRARIVAVRFVRTDAPPASPANDAATVGIADVPRRSLSEAIRDVSLAAVVGERSPAS